MLFELIELCSFLSMSGVDARCLLLLVVCAACRRCGRAFRFVCSQWIPGVPGVHRVQGGTQFVEFIF